MYSKRGGRVEAEAAALAVARHPGVVDLVDTLEGTLRTRMVDGCPVGQLGPMAAGEVAGLAAAIAATLADLHDLGVVHGGIDASHVLVTGAGRPVLCSLGRGGAPADDVAALGRLVAQLVAESPPEAPRRPGPRWRPRLGPMLAPPAGPVLCDLAAKATAADPAARPTARAFADAVGQRIPAARLPRPRSSAAAVAVVPSAPASRVRSPRAAMAVGAASLTGLVALAGGWALSERAPGTRDVAGGPVDRVTAVPVATTTPTTATTTASAPTTSPMATRVWPLEPLDFRDGVLNYGGARYALGRPGDVLVAGDWRCTGSPTLALLDKDGGRVFAFDSWPDTDAVVTARPVGHVDGATDLRLVDADGDGCDDLEVQRAGSSPVVLRVAT